MLYCVLAVSVGLECFFFCVLVDLVMLRLVYWLVVLGLEGADVS